MVQSLGEEVLTGSHHRRS